MLMNLSQPLVIGEAAELTLVFRNSPDVSVQAQVREPAPVEADPGV
jgi:copper(I)-binding protein